MLIVDDISAALDMTSATASLPATVFALATPLQSALLRHRCQGERGRRESDHRYAARCDGVVARCALDARVHADLCAGRESLLTVGRSGRARFDVWGALLVVLLSGSVVMLAACGLRLAREHRKWFGAGGYWGYRAVSGIAGAVSSARSLAGFPPRPLIMVT